MNINIIKYFVRITSLSLILLLFSCKDETFDVPDYTTSGEDVTVTIQVDFPDMQPLTRGTLNEYNRNMVNDVYIRSYSASTGLATSKWVEDTFFTSGQQALNTGNPVSFTFETQSGYNYIVAVANAKENYGFIKGAEDSDPQLLYDLIMAADTWEDFLNIVAISPTGDEMINPNPPLPMAGCYYPESSHPMVSKWQDDDFQSYFIPVRRDKAVEISGAIHLRRLASEINFNIIPGKVNLPDDTSCGLEITVNSFEIVNVPRYSWLYERPTEDGMLTNYGDNATSEEEADKYYTSQRFAGNMVDKDNDGNSSFYFYMDENKHTGNDNCTDYNGRAKKSGKLYSSLTDVGSNSWTTNQMATYVKMTCSIEYEQDVPVNEKGEIVSGGTDMTRTANVDYYIHLGYINNVATDFNSYRNCRYTYNVTVNGVNDIVVDAFSNEEAYHGEEGTVVDLVNKTIELDAHYHAFNVQLTEEELDNENFGFIIVTYRDGIQYVFNDDDNFENGNIDGSPKYYDRELYNWIELHPTTGPTTLAPYLPRFGDNIKDDYGKVTFLLTQLKTKRDANGNVLSTPWDNMDENMKSDDGWYTVYVNEYSYEPMYEGESSSTENNGDSSKSNDPAYGDETEDRWREYVNQNPRRFYIKTQRHTSPDGNSIYAISKYGVTQHSMQSYYSYSVKGETAIGIEWVNETLGMNMRSSFEGTLANNGRANVAQWLSKSTTNLTINGDESSRPSWSTFVVQTGMQQVAAVTDEDRLQGGASLEARLGENAYMVPQIVKYTGTIESFWPTSRDPQGSNTIGSTDISSYIENINACMNRNRDNNGNGKIDPEELRWYVPSSSQYLRILLGEESLNEPLMKWDVTNLPTYPNKDTNRNNYLPRYMFLTSSNGTVLWAVEGMSTSTLSQLWSWSKDTDGDPVSYPWQVRCIRNLGTDLTSVSTTDNDDVQQAYVEDSSNKNIIRMTYYDVASIRSNKFYGNGNSNGQMPIHFINDGEYNSTYRAFQYADEDIEITTQRTEGDIQDYINDNPCATKYGTEWRIPNQKELAILRNMGVLTGNYEWFSCTALYYNMVTGVGGYSLNEDKEEYISDDNYILIMYNDHGSIGRKDNLNSHNHRVRCVRDVD